MSDKSQSAKDGLGAIAAALRMNAAIQEAEAAGIIGDSEAFDAAVKRAHEMLDAQINLKISAHIGLTKDLR